MIRHEKGDETRLFIRDLSTGDVTKDPLVQPGDKIFAPIADTFYIYGGSTRRACFRSRAT
ncbi:MAG: hypothetical protein KIS90_00105 [Phenylobacterium sp.]|nr:hypothetical protein [Phenylobacterium sp.]